MNANCGHGVERNELRALVNYGGAYGKAKRAVLKSR